jgi:hypothetical protein
MELDDFLETEVGVAVAATAALFSPRVRKALRQGAVYGVAGALMAGDAIAGFAKGVGRGAQQVAASANGASAEAAPSRRAAARKGGETSPETKKSLHGTTTDGMSPGAAASTAASISGGQATTNPADETKSGRKGREKPTNE